jgi:hypothetical protein
MRQLRPTPVKDAYRMGPGYAGSGMRTSENSSSTQFVNKGKKKAGAALNPDPLRLGSATLKSKVLLYALALTYLLREMPEKHQLCPTPG